jgi:hypothetical protein
VVDPEFKNRTTLGAAEERRTFKEGHGSMQQGFKGTVDELDPTLPAYGRKARLDMARK